MKTALPLAALAALALAACETIPEKGEFVPYRSVLAETRDTPFECSGFEPMSGTCEALGRSTLRGNIVTTDTIMAIDEGLPTTVKIRSRHRLEADGRTCGVIGEPRVTVTSASGPEANAAIEDLFKVIIGGVLEDACVSYYRSPVGYVTEVTGRDGTLVPDGRSHSRFFAEAQPVRPLEF